MKHYDLVVIGAGPGGYIAALRAAQLGLKTACIDKREVPGGTCLNVGCIPSKTLLYSTEYYSRLQHQGKEFGIQFEKLSFDFNQMMKRKKEVVKGLVDGVNWLFNHHKVDFIIGEAKFKNPNTIEVNGEEIGASYFILALGSEPISLPNLPFDEKQIVSSTGALSLSKVPKHLIVIGGGIIGVELASVYKRLGSNVTIVEMLDRICAVMDKKVSQTLLQLLQKQGIKFYLDSKVITAVIQPEEVILTINQGEKLFNLSGDVVLVAAGRKPLTTGLDFIHKTDKGLIQVDSAFRTNHSHIFAIGDLIEGPMLAHKASEEGTAVAEFIVGLGPKPINYLAIPNVIYTSPEVAAVGMTEEEAKAVGLQVKTGIAYFKSNARVRCMGESEGFVKVIGEANTGRLIGMHIVGPEASELIVEGMMAIEKKATIEELAYCVNPHPTLSESIKEAAVQCC